MLLKDLMKIENLRKIMDMIADFKIEPSSITIRRNRAKINYTEDAASLEKSGNSLAIIKIDDLASGIVVRPTEDLINSIKKAQPDWWNVLINSVYIKNGEDKQVYRYTGNATYGKIQHIALYFSPVSYRNIKKHLEDGGSLIFDYSVSLRSNETKEK